ncbi:hybrid sensor histidine kinase/response regulator [Massilia sp. METH4]|uniref:hybrid sensor histidine kinase/response regulator n=1 Tax=Massilia sp. METH4 TaxID=3123041 RepID=UPI0030CC61BF
MPGAFLLLRPDPGFTIVGASDAYLQATLRQRAEVMGRPVFEVFPDNPDTPEANATLNLSRSLERVVASRQPDVMAVQRYDVPAASGAGFELRYWSPVNAPVFADDGTILCIVHRVDNVTEYVRLAEENARQRSVTERLSADKIRMEAEIVERSLELDRLNGDLRGANRELSEYAARAADAARNKDEFLAMLAHELRNPLGAMSSALQLAAITRPDEPRYPGLLEVCRRQVKNLTRLVDDLLEMSRIDRGAVELHRGPLDLRDLIENAMHAARELFERRRLTISTRIAPANFAAFGDATRLEQALTNLLTNAAKYSEPGGNVELRLEPAAGQERWARLEVRDEGRGIPPEKLDAIFDIFVQVDPGIDRSRGGLGIGLALVRSIVGLHGGSVRAHSEGIGKGSRFVIELPLATLAELERHEQADVPAAAAPAAAPGAAPGRVLIVEDNADARETLLALLTAFGYSVSTAATGGEGLERLIATRPDVAIIDIGLPEVDGFELARQARKALGRATRLVALTGYNTQVVRAAALDAGFDMYVTKPCTPAKLAEILAVPGSGRS